MTPIRILANSVPLQAAAGVSEPGRRENDLDQFKNQSVRLRLLWPAPWREKRDTAPNEAELIFSAASGAMASARSAGEMMVGNGETMP